MAFVDGTVVTLTRRLAEPGFSQAARQIPRSERNKLGAAQPPAGLPAAQAAQVREAIAFPSNPFGGGGAGPGRLMAVVNWTEHARDDLREVFDFIARDSPRAAEALVEEYSADRTTRKISRKRPESPGVP